MLKGYIDHKKTSKLCTYPVINKIGGKKNFSYLIQQGLGLAQHITTGLMSSTAAFLKFKF